MDADRTRGANVTWKIPQHDPPTLLVSNDTPDIVEKFARKMGLEKWEKVWGVNQLDEYNSKDRVIVHVGQPLVSRAGMDILNWIQYCWRGRVVLGPDTL